MTGGKAEHLAELQRAGFPVPPFVCVTTPEQAVAAFDANFPPDALVAVRSSAVGEDSARDSFAGQLETYLFVDRKSLPERVAACLASAESERVRLYRQLRGVQGGGISVVIQQMVESEVSGILFTANPATDDPSECVVVAGMGLGEGVVGDRVETDTWYVSASGAIRCVASEKRSKVVFDRERGRGTKLVAVEPTSRPALSESQVRELVALGRRIEAHFGSPQDIEWAFDSSGRLFVLQARPITTLGPRGIFDNSNIVESYPGISLPLTFSFVRRAYEETFRQAAKDLGVPEQVLQRNASVCANLVAHIQGRIYYNILNWYRLYLLVPGFEWALPAWEKALGLEASVRPEGVRANPLGTLRVLWRLLARFARLQGDIRRFKRRFEEAQAEFRRRRLDELTVPELLALYDWLAKRLMRGFAISVVNDVFAQQLVYRLGARGREHLRGEAGMESVRPVRSMLELTDTLRARPDLRAVVESDRSAEEIWHVLMGDPSFGEALRRHLELYGDRTLHELKLETPPAEENPEFLIAMFRNYLRVRPQLPVVPAGCRLGPQEALVLRYARRCVCYREDLRLYRSRAFGMVKRIFLAIGRKLFEHPQDVFYLTLEELRAGQNLEAIVALRKREFETYRHRSPPNRIVTPGFASQNVAASATPGPSAEELRGIGCGGGRALGVAKVIHSPTQDMRINGEILVAPMTDPGWVFLMVSASGIVSERGSLLSHTAIIGRELGIPTVVGVKDATRRIRDGQRIEVDAHTGIVRLRP